MLSIFVDSSSGHRNLALKHRILHRDVGTGNILLNNLKSGSGAPRGFLIDLNFAIQMDHASLSGARHRIGTLTFMSIEVLRNTSHVHNIRDDLESFLYGLIYLCTYFCGSGGRAAPDDPMIASWSSGKWKMLAGNKTGQMVGGAPFRNILDEYAAGMEVPRPLTEEWRRLLFRWDADELQFLYVDPAELYEGMLDALVKALGIV